MAALSAKVPISKPPSIEILPRILPSEAPVEPTTPPPAPVWDQKLFQDNEETSGRKSTESVPSVDIFKILFQSPEEKLLTSEPAVSTTPVIETPVDILHTSESDMNDNTPISHFLESPPSDELPVVVIEPEQALADVEVEVDEDVDVEVDVDMDADVDATRIDPLEIELKQEDVSIDALSSNDEIDENFVEGLPLATEVLPDFDVSASVEDVPPEVILAEAVVEHEPVLVAELEPIADSLPIMEAVVDDVVPPSTEPESLPLLDETDTVPEEIAATPVGENYVGRVDPTFVLRVSDTQSSPSLASRLEALVADKKPVVPRAPWLGASAIKDPVDAKVTPSQLEIPTKDTVETTVDNVVSPSVLIDFSAEDATGHSIDKTVVNDLINVSEIAPAVVESVNLLDDVTVHEVERLENVHSIPQPAAEIVTVAFDNADEVSYDISELVSTAPSTQVETDAAAVSQDLVVDSPGFCVDGLQSALSEYVVEAPAITDSPSLKVPEYVRPSDPFSEYAVESSVRLEDADYLNVSEEDSAEVAALATEVNTESLVKPITETYYDMSPTFELEASSEDTLSSTAASVDANAATTISALSLFPEEKSTGSIKVEIQTIIDKFLNQSAVCQDQPTEEVVEKPVEFAPIDVYTTTYPEKDTAFPALATLAGGVMLLSGILPPPDPMQATFTAIMVLR